MHSTNTFREQRQDQTFVSLHSAYRITPQLLFSITKANPLSLLQWSQRQQCGKKHGMTGSLESVTGLDPGS